MPPRMSARSDGRPDRRIIGGEGLAKLVKVGGSELEVSGIRATRVEVKGMVGIKMAMPSMTTSGVMLGMSLRTTTIEKMESVQDMSGCGDNQKVKYTAGSFVGKDLTWWNSSNHTLGREVVVGMSWDNFKVLMREEFCPSNEMQKLETELWNHAMVGAGHAAYIDRFHELARDDNKRTRTGNAFATTANPVRREYTGMSPNSTACNYHHSPETPWNRYLRKGRKTKPKRQNRTQNGKA
ncbi:reverse transcriptase domain-containing protein [Tanacetum coccineum]